MIHGNNVQMNFFPVTFTLRVRIVPLRLSLRRDDFELLVARLGGLYLQPVRNTNMYVMYQMLVLNVGDVF